VQRLPINGIKCKRRDRPNRSIYFNHLPHLPSVRPNGENPCRTHPPDGGKSWRKERKESKRRFAPSVTDANRIRVDIKERVARLRIYRRRAVSFFLSFPPPRIDSFISLGNTLVDGFTRVDGQPAWNERIRLASRSAPTNRHVSRPSAAVRLPLPVYARIFAREGESGRGGSNHGRWSARVSLRETRETIRNRNSEASTRRKKILAHE